jgi:hypothetical protein
MNKAISSNFASYKKVFLFAFALALVIGGFLAAGSASAEATIDNVTLDGLNNITVIAGSPMTAKVDVSLTSPTAWKSTQYKFGNGSIICVDTPDHQGNGASAETFAITAPSKLGTSKVNFKVYENNDCTNGRNITSVLAITGVPASLLTAAINIFSFGTGGAWLSIALLILIIIAGVFVISYIIKRIVDKKSKITRNV